MLGERLEQMFRKVCILREGGGQLLSRFRILLTFGKADPVPKMEGFHFKIPLVQEVIILDVKKDEVGWPGAVK